LSRISARSAFVAKESRCPARITCGQVFAGSSSG
jgi:hypothetical protein